jgi:hypothetical protein
MIASCAPSLKPLFKNFLGLKSLTPQYGYSNSNGYGRNGRSTGTRSRGDPNRGYTKQNSKTGAPDAFELKDTYSTTINGRDAASSPGPYHSGGDGDSADRNGSQETILKGAHIPGKGITRVTEVSVTY